MGWKKKLKIEKIRLGNNFFGFGGCDLRDVVFGNETVDGGRDGRGGFGESLRVEVVKPNVDAVHGSDLGYSRSHLATPHHTDSLHL